MANRILRNEKRLDGRYLVEIDRDAIGNEKLTVVPGQGIEPWNLRFSRAERSKFKVGDRFYLTIVHPENTRYYMSTDTVLIPEMDSKRTKKNSLLSTRLFRQTHSNS